MSQHINAVSVTCKTNSVRIDKCSEPLQTSSEQIPYISESINTFNEPKTQNNSTGLSGKLNKLQNYKKYNLFNEIVNRILPDVEIHLLHSLKKTLPSLI